VSLRSKWRALARWKRLLLGALALGLFAFAVIASGVIPFFASADHPEPFATILDFAKHRSIATWSTGISEPETLEDDEALVTLGAGHFEQGCRFCHGTPWDRPSWTHDSFSPPPPPLEPIAEEYDAKELYLIVDHGVVFTAMPAWPARDRDDEPWAVVAFLRALPELDREGYEALIDRGDELETPPVVRERCVQCHGVDGLGRSGAAPVLAGQREPVLTAALRAYAEGERHSGFMQMPAAALSDDELEDAASYYAGLEGLGATEAPETGEGARIAAEGIAERAIPACADCHGPASHEHAEVHPILAGQDRRYLRQQLRLFAEGTRGGSEHAGRMDPVASHELRLDERAAVAAYYAALGGR